MAYEDLTAAQKDSLQAWIALVRQWCGEQARTNNHGAAIDSGYNYTITDILAELSDNEVLPHAQSDYHGSEALTKAKLIGLMAHIQGILGSYNSVAHRGLWQEACGPGGLIG